MERKRKKKNRLRGNRSHGKGNTKNSRGAGCRGGRGRAGSHKHKYSKYHKTFGTKKRLKPKTGKKAVSIERLNEIIDGLAEKNKVKKEGKKYLIGKEFPYKKIVSPGTPEGEWKIRGIKLSASAKEAIEAAGGKAEEEK